MTQHRSARRLPRPGWLAGVCGVGTILTCAILAAAATRAEEVTALPPLQVVPSSPARPDLSPLYRRYGIPTHGCNRSAIGAVAGGLLGGVIGDRISDGSEGGVIAGSLVGALIGNLIGRGFDEASAQCGAPSAPPTSPVPRAAPGGPTLQI